MIRAPHIQARSLLMALAFAAPLASHAQLTLRPASPLAIPTFTCANAPDPLVTPGALKNPGQALSTTAISVADRGNQQRWAYAFDPATPGSHTVPLAVAGSTEQIPTSYTLAGNVAPADLSSLSTMAWQHFSGREVFAYSGGTAAAPQLGTGQSLGSVGFYLSNPNGGAAANRTRFFQFQFQLAPEVNPSTYRLTLNGQAADDQILKYYVNGVAWPTTTMPLGGGATADQQWRTGPNTLTVAIFDTNPSATRLIVAGATSSDCAADMRLLAVTVAVQIPVISPAQTQTFTGVATATPGAGSAAPMPAGTPITLTLAGPNGFTATQASTVPGNDGQYSVVWPAGLAPGDYTVIASLTDQPATQSTLGTFVVRADVPVVPTVAQPVPTLSQWSLLALSAFLALMGMGQTRRRKN